MSCTNIYTENLDNATSKLCRFTPQNKDKYLGNVKRIIYRSNWERKFMVYCDRNDSIKHWGSEEVVVRYRNPIDKKLHNYFPDFVVTEKDKYLIEINQSSFTIKPKPSLVRLDEISQ